MYVFILHLLTAQTPSVVIPAPAVSGIGGMSLSEIEALIGILIALAAACKLVFVTDVYVNTLRAKDATRDVDDKVRAANDKQIGQEIVRLQTEAVSLKAELDRHHALDTAAFQRVESAIRENNAAVLEALKEMRADMRVFMGREDTSPNRRLG